MVQGTVWCELCHTCCVVQFNDRPTGVVYEGGLGLPVSSVLPGVFLKKKKKTDDDVRRSSTRVF